MKMPPLIKKEINENATIKKNQKEINENATI